MVKYHRIEQSLATRDTWKDTLAVQYLLRNSVIVPEFDVAGEGMLCVELNYGVFVRLLWLPWQDNYPHARSVRDVYTEYSELLVKFDPRESLAESSAFATQEGGKHYSQMPEGYQPFQISKALGLNPVEHTVLKYILRHASKNGKQDLLKAKHCLDILIEQDYPDAP